MADVKISALPLASTPLAGTEVLPIVQSATTDQVSVANLTAGRAVSAASLTLTTTPLAVGSGGTGLTSLTAGYIPFGAGTSAFGSDSNLFWDNTNKRLGVGTATPAYRLDVRSTTDSAVYFATTGTSNSISAYLASGNGTTSGKYAYLRFLNNDTNAQEYRLGTYGDNNFTIYDAKAATTRLTLDSVGNLGLGVTPSGNFLIQTPLTNSSSAANLHGFRFNYCSFGSSGSDYPYYGYNMRFQQTNGSYLYDVADTATAMRFGADIRFYVAASGSAGTAITFTQAMTLDASGNLLVGTTSSPTTGTECLTLGTGTAPTASPADTVTFYSTDRSAGNTIPSVYCEGSGVTNAGITSTTVTHKIAMRVNGTVYYLLATTNAT